MAPGAETYNQPPVNKRNESFISLLKGQLSETIQSIHWFNFISSIHFFLVSLMESKRYYNSKYIDAEETDVSRNQTSTWLIDDWRLLMKQRYAAGHQQQENKSILLFRMGRIVCFHLLRPSAAQENEWMKEEKIKWKFVFDEWMVSFLAEKERARQLSFFLGGLRAAASRRQPAKKRDERRAVEQTNKIIQFEKEWTNWLFLWLRGRRQKSEWTNQLTWVICLCGIEEFMNQWSKTKSESIEFVNGAQLTLLS